MLRKFTKKIGRYKEGELHDYPKSVWESLAKSAKAKLDSFTESADLAQALQNPLRGPVRTRNRAGAAAH